LRHFDAAHKIQPRFPPLYTLIGNLYLQQGDLAGAQKYYQQALAIDPDFAVAAANLAWTYLRQNTNLNQALSLAEKARQLMPDVDSISETLAMAYYQQGLYAKAVPLFEDCVQKAPRDPSYHYHLGLALIAAGEPQMGRHELQAALKINLPEADARQARQTLATTR